MVIELHELSQNDGPLKFGIFIPENEGTTMSCWLDVQDETGKTHLVFARNVADEIVAYLNAKHDQDGIMAVVVRPRDVNRDTCPGERKAAGLE